MAASLCLLLLYSAATLRVGHLQTTGARTNVGNCALPTSELGQTEVLSQYGLIAGVFNADSSGSPRPFVQIITAHYVCQASGTVRDTVSSISLVVEYRLCFASCANSSNILITIDQFQFDCFADAIDPHGGSDMRKNVFAFDPNTSSPSVIASLVRSDSSGVVANFSTPLATHCGECADGTMAAPDHCVRTLIVHF